MICNMIRRVWLRMEIRLARQALDYYDIVRCPPAFVIHTALRLSRLERELEKLQ
jgi:hypothetical protein